MVFWNPDTCHCRIEIDSNYNFIDWVQKCELHKNLNNQVLIVEVMKHNKSFNYKFGNIDLNPIQTKEIAQDRKNEFTRIKLLGDGIEK